MTGVESARDGDVVQPVRMSARSCRETFQREQRLTRALEQIRDLRPDPSGEPENANESIMRSTAAAALEEQP